jgi:hypothetical protein
MVKAREACPRGVGIANNTSCEAVPRFESRDIHNHHALIPNRQLDPKMAPYSDRSSTLLIFIVNSIRAPSMLLM